MGSNLEYRQSNPLNSSPGQSLTKSVPEGLLAQFYRYIGENVLPTLVGTEKELPPPGQGIRFEEEVPTIPQGPSTLDLALLGANTLPFLKLGLTKNIPPSLGKDVIGAIFKGVPKYDNSIATPYPIKGITLGDLEGVDFPKGSHLWNKFGPDVETVREAWAQVAPRYPRLAPRIEKLIVDPWMPIDARAAYIPEIKQMLVNPHSMSYDKDKALVDVIGSLSHEFTHVGQEALGSKGLKSLGGLTKEDFKNLANEYRKGPGNPTYHRVEDPAMKRGETIWNKGEEIRKSHRDRQ